MINLFFSIIKYINQNIKLNYINKQYINNNNQYINDIFKNKNNKLNLYISRNNNLL